MKLLKPLSGSIVLDDRESQLRTNGFPVLVKLSKSSKPKRFSLGLNFFREDWDFERQEPKTDKRLILHIRKKKVLLDELKYNSLNDASITLDYAKKALLGQIEDVVTDTCFFEFGEMLVREIEQQKDEKGVVKRGNARAYENALNQLKLYRSNLRFQEVDYNFLQGFKQWQMLRGNKKTTINTYLRKYRAIYNEGVRRVGFENTKPFEDAFKGVGVKKNRTKKRHVSKEVVRILENLSGLAEGQQNAVDFWLLQFYFGGQDFKDIYYLENFQLNKGRCFFTRGKLDENGYQFDLKIVEKAQKIIDKYKVEGRFLFPWRKDYDGYRNFIRRVQKNLVTVQTRYNDALLDEAAVKIEVLPLGGNLTPKVSRHTFATIGSRMFVEPDLLRSLMGHERDDVDTIYKDVYPAALRDEWHLKIIDTDLV